MDQETVIKELYELPDLIREAEKDYYNAKKRLNIVKQNLHFKKCELYLGDIGAGRNQDDRDAERFPYISDLLEEVTHTENELHDKYVDYYYLRRKMESLTAIADLLKR